jgi:Fic family protein
MRKDQVAPRLRKYLVPVEGKPNVLAMVAPPTPRRLPSDDYGAPALLDEANRALGTLAGSMAHWTHPDLLTRTLSRREAVQSSQIEGTQTQLDELLTYEVTLGVDGLPADVKVTERYVHALQLGLDAVRSKGRSAITVDLVHQLHATLMQDAAADFPKGQYRTVQAYIGALGGRMEDARFVPTPPADIAECLAEMERSILQYAPAEDEQTALSIVAQIAIAHAQFETIHPYSDGNGRTGRLLMPLILAAENHPPLYLSGSLLRNRLRYYDALNLVQLRGEWSPWMNLLCQAIKESAEDAVAIAQDLNRLVANWDELLTGYRKDSVVRRLPPLLIGHPVVSAREVARLLNVSVRSALTGIDDLVKTEILSSPRDRKWGRVFQAKAVLDRLNQVPG